MDFTDKELAVIVQAKKKVKAAFVIRLLIIVATLISIALMYAGLLGADRFAFVAIAAVFLSIAQPQLAGGPKYEDLVRLLESKSRR